MSEREVFLTIFECGDDAGHWIEIELNNMPYERIGPFASPEARDRAKNDLLQMVRSHGGKDDPL